VTHFTKPLETEVIHNVVVTLLAGALHSHGSKQELARAVGIKLPIISRILRGQHMPSIKTAQRIAHALPISRDEQLKWRDYVEHYWLVKRAAENQNHELQQGFNENAFVALRWRHHYAQFGDHPSAQQIAYFSVYQDASDFIRAVSPEVHPVRYAGLCAMLHDCSDVLGNTSESLLWVKRYRHVALQVDPNDYSNDQEFVLDLQVNSLRCEAATLHKLGLHREAIKFCLQARDTDGFRHDHAFWSLQIARDHINALSCIPRFALSEAEGIAVQAWRAAEKGTHELNELLSMLLICSLADAYIAHGQTHRATKILAPFIYKHHRIPLAGPVHQSRLLCTWAKVQIAYREFADAQQCLDDARQIAQTAQLSAELTDIELLQKTLLQKFLEG